MRLRRWRDMAAYYNEIDPFAAAWLRELIKAGLIADGEVDERDIRDVRADDLRGFAQCHFFAGIGGWSYALRLAGWPDDRPVWTGSCPCQPFSSARKRQGGADDRHLWPHWARLIRESRPVAILGEQVESAISHGWLDAVFDDLEREGYACGATCLPAASVGAPHLRQRLWFVANAEYAERGALCLAGQDERDGQDGGWPQAYGEPGARREVRALADTERRATERRRGASEGQAIERRGDVSLMGDAESPDGQVPIQRRRSQQTSVESGGSSGSGFWSACDWIYCRDGKYRAVEPGTFPLAHGVSGRVGRLRGYGNAIVPQVAAAFIEAYLEATA